MYLIIIYALAVTVMVYFSVKKGPDRSVIRKSSSAALFWIALTLLTLYGALWLVFGVGEISGWRPEWIESPYSGSLDLYIDLPLLAKVI